MPKNGPKVRNVVADLRAAVDALKAKVAEAEKAKAASLTKADNILDKAKEDLRRFTESIGESLGLRLPRKPGPKPGSRASAAGGGESEGGTGEADGAEDGGKAGKGDERIRKGSKRLRVKNLWEAGKGKEEIAAALDMTVGGVEYHLRILMDSGSIKERPSPSSLPSSPVNSLPKPAGGAGEQVPSSLSPLPLAPVKAAAPARRGSSLDELRQAVAKLQEGHRSKAVILGTTIDDGHRHSAMLDRMGDGVTTPDETKHVHRVFRFVISMSEKHQHELLAK
jgi:hypothetical protein